MRARDPFRLVIWQSTIDRTQRLKAYPRPESVRRILAPIETQAFTGSEVARVKGDGIEYADIRDFVPGDRVRAINWRASARRQGLVVNERHPEQVYFCTRKGQVFGTHDGGATWKEHPVPETATNIKTVACASA